MNSTINQLRAFGFLEGASLLVLLFVAVPMKYIWNDPSVTKLVGPIHGGLFLLYLFRAFSVAIERNWKFSQITWKLLLACFIPFGTFYVDRVILRKLDRQ